MQNNNEAWDNLKKGGHEGNFLPLEINGKGYVMRKPSVREVIRIESNNTTVDGKSDVYGMMLNIVDLIKPNIKIDDLCKVDEVIELNVGDRVIKLLNMTLDEVMDITANGYKFEANRKGEMVAKPNIEWILDFILGKSETNLDDLKYSEAKMLINEFESSVDIKNIMEVYTFFQENFQA